MDTRWKKEKIRKCCLSDERDKQLVDLAINLYNENVALTLDREMKNLIIIIGDINIPDREKSLTSFIDLLTARKSLILYKFKENTDLQLCESHPPPPEDTSIAEEYDAKRYVVTELDLAIDILKIKSENEVVDYEQRLV